MKKAAGVARSVSAMDLPYNVRVNILQGKVLPMGLYGAPVVPIPKGCMRELRSSIATALDPKAA
eukprot:6545100-Alexandrium_andersonii.AAC.1